MGLRVLVTGASGYLGGRLCGALVHGGYAVVALVLKSTKIKDLPPQAELVYGDIRDAESVRRACAGCDFVVHSAALVGSWLPDASQFIKVNVEGLRVVIEAVKATPSECEETHLHFIIFRRRPYRWLHRRRNAGPLT